MHEVSQIIASRSGTDERLTLMVALSVLAHAVFVTLVIFAPPLGLPETGSEPVMTISLGGAPGANAGGMTPMGGRPVQAPVPVDPGPPMGLPAPARKSPEMVLPTENAVTARPRVQPEVSARNGVNSRPVTGETIQQGTARAETGARGQGFGLTTSGGSGTSGAYVDVANFCCPEYLQAVTQAIQRNWNSKHNTTGSTLVKFIILRNGILEDVVVERPSGFFALDMAAQRALLVTKQAPPLPDLFSNDTLTVHLWFEYHR